MARSSEVACGSTARSLARRRNPSKFDRKNRDRVPVRRTGESPQARIERSEKKAPNARTRCAWGGEKKGGAPREKTSAQKPGEPRRVRERTGDHCKITCTVKPISRSNHTDRGAPCLPTPRGPRKVVRYVASMPPCLARAMQPEQVDHADFVETEPTESWSETVAALTFAAWAWLSRAPQAARCYS
jgi:hypothetical protein